MGCRNVQWQMYVGYDRSPTFGLELEKASLSP